METMPNTMPEENTQEDVVKKTAEDLEMDPVTGELPVDKEIDAHLNQAKNPDDMKEAA